MFWGTRVKIVRKLEIANTSRYPNHKKQHVSIVAIGVFQLSPLLTLVTLLTLWALTLKALENLF